MRLIFEGQAIVERGFDGVKFVGRYVVEASREERYIICRITREALERRSGLTEATPEELLAAYQSASEEINSLASAQFSGSIERPLLAAEDLVRDSLGTAAA
jgi:hypothetical protein